MPHVIVKIAFGKTRQQKEDIAASVTQAIMTSADVGIDAVSVSIEEFERSDWAEAVYRPDILDRPDALFKKPGYNPF